jgi:hypothetical protein
MHFLNCWCAEVSEQRTQWGLSTTCLPLKAPVLSTCREQQTRLSDFFWEGNVSRHLVTSFCARTPTLLFHIEVEFAVILWINNICCNSRKMSNCTTFFQILISLTLASALLPLKEKDYFCIIIIIYFAFFSFMHVHPFVGPWPLFSFLNFYKVGRTPWSRDQPVASSLHTQTQTSMSRVDSNPRPQCLGGLWRFIP